MNRVYDDEDNEPMDESLLGGKVYGIYGQIKRVITIDTQVCPDTAREIADYKKEG